jgi:cation diffusion facilitator family transporter
MGIDRLGRRSVQRAAALSVFAALLLTSLKIIVGILTNSIGVISEAFHSGLDLMAAAITLGAVRSASKAPDIEHPYGHGKIENFSALIETILLWITSAWIIYEALRRIIAQEVIEPSIWGIAAMLASIIIDFERSRILYRAANQYNSQALEADALHFRTDMLSSVVVLLGLLMVSFGFPIGDPLGALGVSIVILYVSYNLAKRSFNFLIDRAPEGVRDTVIKTCANIPGVLDCSRVRARTSGPELFVDVIVTVDETVSTSESHIITESIESALAYLAPKVDVMVHVEPAEMEPTRLIRLSIYDQLQVLARREPQISSVHNIRVFPMDDGFDIAADLEMAPDLTLEEAHKLSDLFEARIRQLEPRVRSARLHLETTSVESKASDVTIESSNLVERVKELIENSSYQVRCSRITVKQDKSGLSLLIDCSIDGTTSLVKSHEISDDIEKRVMESFSDVSYVFVHIEPL